MNEQPQKADLGWVTCVSPPDEDRDEQVSLDALAAAGIGVQKLAWDDPSAPPPSAFRACVLRSCWNYYEDPPAFDRWLARAAESSLLWNGLEVARWNLHKRYLAALEQAGVPIVPTVFVDRGERLDLEQLARRTGWHELVVKPSVSAGSFATRRFDAGDPAAAQAFLDGHLRTRDMMVQCFVPSVLTEGERCLVWIDGAFSHAIDKRPRFDDDEESVSDELPVLPEERALGEQVLEAAARVGGFSREALLYARVDTVLHEGRRVLGELELLEPSLFVLESPAGLRRLVGAIAARLAAAQAK